MQKLSLWKESIRFEDSNPDDEGALPHAPQSFRKPAVEYYRALRNVGFELFKAVSAESLGMEADHILNATGSNRATTSALHHYPRCPDPATIGFLPHRNSELDGGPSGVKRTQIITNGKFKSVLHRGLTNTEKARSSIVCALIPTPDAMVGPLFPFINEKNPALYSSDTFFNFFYDHFAKLLKWTS